MAHKLVPPDQVKGFPAWIGVSHFEGRARNPDRPLPPPSSKWAAFRDWVLGYRLIYLSDWLERRFPPRSGRR
jgi:hypothetical protein